MKETTTRRFIVMLVALVSATTPALSKDFLPIRQGIYARASVACRNAPNADLQSSLSIILQELALCLRAQPSRNIALFLRLFVLSVLLGFGALACGAIFGSAAALELFAGNSQDPVVVEQLLGRVPVYAALSLSALVLFDVALAYLRGLRRSPKFGDSS